MINFLTKGVHRQFGGIRKRQALFASFPGKGGLSMRWSCQQIYHAISLEGGSFIDEIRKGHATGTRLFCLGKDCLISDFAKKESAISVLFWQQ